ncbi:MAG: N-acetylmuramic acid 6-phosphate etherase [Phycisphaerales bacterium]|nr:N-acetylmuramic acid 6-phosphate etherase [Phycisphaerales bacterium]
MTQPILPPDRGRVATEQRNLTSTHLDQLTTLQQVQAMAQDHAVVHQAVANAAPALAAFIDALVPRVRHGGRLFYCGAGTSGRLGVLDASECPPTFCSDPSQVIGLIAGGDVALRRSSERREDDPQGTEAEFVAHALGASDAVLAIAAGGTTPYALGAIPLAKARGALTALLVCSPRERTADCDHLIVLATGAEMLTGSTRLKAGSATKLALNCITTLLFTQLGKVHGNLMVDLAATNDKLVDRAIRVLQMLDPSLDRPSAAALLQEGGGRVKTALVMRSRTMDRTAAEAHLLRCDGNLRRALEAK